MYIIHNSCYSGTDSGKGLRGSGTLGPKKKDLVGKFFPKKKKKGLGPPYQNDLAPIPAGQPSQEHISACKSKKKKCKKEKKKTENEGKKEKRKERRDRHSEKKTHASRCHRFPSHTAYPNGKRPHQRRHRRHAHAKPILILAAGCSICPAQLHCSSSTHKYLIYPFLVSFKT